MTRPVLATFALLALEATAPPALAQISSLPSTRLSGVTVVAPAAVPPKVVATFPADGKSVTPGALIVKVTFDQKMDPEGWDYGKGPDAFPQCLDRPRLEPDGKTFVLLCTVAAQSRFSITLNGAGPGAFENLAGQKATPAASGFTTDDAKSVSTISDAMKAAALKADEGPVMDSGPAAVASASAAPKR